MENTTSQPSEFKLNTNSQMKFKITLQKTSLFDQSYAYIHVKGTITFIWKGADAAAVQVDRNNK